MKETTIYMLSGGGQKARECAELGLKIEIEKRKSDLPARTGLAGQDNYANCMWSEDLDRLLGWIAAWVGDDDWDYEVVETDARTGI